jgi:hypothetical protein
MASSHSSNSCRFPVLLVAFLLLAAGPGFANWFGKDKQIPDWGLEAAKTHVPDYAKNAAAVVLFHEYVETVDAQGRAIERERQVFRLLKLQARHDGVCGVSFDVDEKINYFHAWTIAADEKQYPAQDTDFADVGNVGDPTMMSTERVRIVVPPASDVGATVICESEKLLKPYMQEKVWEFQSDIPTVFQALEIDLPTGRAYSEAWHRFQPVKPAEVSPNHWRWELKDVHALDLRDVKSHPGSAALVARMSVQWGDASIEGKDNQWRAIGQWVATLEANRPDPSPEITTQVQTLIGGAPDFYSKLSRITDYIQKNVRYFIVMRGIGGLQANHAADIFRNRYGDCKDKTTLLISMLQAAGIHAVYMPVDDHRDVIDPDEPSLLGNHMITAIEIPADVQDPRLKAVVKAKDGKRYLIFDPTNERVPAGNLPDYEQGSYGILAAGASSQIIALPVLLPDANPNEHTGSFILAADGTLTGSVDAIRSGTGGGELRNILKFRDEKERRESLETDIARDVPGVVLNSFQIVQPPDLDKPIEIHYKFTAAQYSHQAGPLLLVRPRVVGSYARPFDDKPRIYPINLEATGRWHDSFDIALPPGYVVDETPDPVNLDLDFASYHSSVSARGNILHYEREYIVRQVELPPDKAKDFRTLESAILSDEKGSAVLKKQ